MPFESKSQMKACFAKKSRGEGKGWNCKEWAEATPNPKALPEHVKKAEQEFIDCFSKLAQYLVPKITSPKQV